MSFDKVHTFYSPHRIMFGWGAAAQLGTEAKRLGATRVQVVTDQGVTRAGLLEPVLESLVGAGVPHVVFDGVEPEPPAHVVDRAAAQCRSERCDCVVGIGGGSALDVAKGVSILATNDGGILNYCGMDQVGRAGVPKILVPTTAGTGSEITRVSVITDTDENTKKVVYSLHCLAELALVDPALTVTCPPRVTADTGMDALVHAVETYVSTNATPFSDVLAERAIELIGKYLPQAWAKGSNREARYHMSLAATLAGMAFASGGLGAVHGLAYVLGTEYHLPHGRSNAVLLPHVMAFNAPGSPTKYARIAALMGQAVEGLAVGAAAVASVRAVQELLDGLQISSCLSDYGIDSADLPGMVIGGMKQERLFATNPRDLGEADVRHIYENAFRR